jgi:hypothetical protein
MNEDPGWRRVTASGRVPCARRGEEVALERCLECNWLLDLDRADGTPELRCAAVSPVSDGMYAGQPDRHVD